MTPPRSQDLDAGEMIGHRYLLSQQLREEPWGTVWLAQDRLLGVEVGLKLLAREDPQFPEGKELLQREAALAWRLRHPHILEILHFEEVEEGAYLLARPFGGLSLAAHLARQPRFHLNLALEVLDQVGQALNCAHEQGTVHQSLNPLAVLLLGEEVQVVNFSFPAVDDDEVMHLELKAYKPPEVIQGEPLTPAGNIFSLGVLGYRLLAGSLPYPLTFDESIPYRLEKLPVDLEEIPSQLQNVLLRCLGQDPEERFRDAGAFLGQFQELREMWRGGGGFRDKWAVWKPGRRPSAREPLKDRAADLGAKAAGLGAKVWEEGKIRAGKMGERLQPCWAKVKALPRPLWWGLGLSCLALLLLVGGYQVFRRTTPTPKPPPPTAKPLKLPEWGGPPMLQREKTLPPRESRPAAPPGAATVGTPPQVSKTTAKEERYLVLAAVYAQPEPAKRLQQRLRAKKIAATLAKVSLKGKTGYQVRVGPLSGAQQAEEMAQRLKSEEGLTPKIIKPGAAPPSGKASRRS